MRFDNVFYTRIGGRCVLLAVALVFLAAGANLRQRRRHRDHDDGGLLHLVVEEAGQAAEAAAAETGGSRTKGGLSGRFLLLEARHGCSAREPGSN